MYRWAASTRHPAQRSRLAKNLPRRSATGATPSSWRSSTIDSTTSLASARRSRTAWSSASCESAEVRGYQVRPPSARRCGAEGRMNAVFGAIAASASASGSRSLLLAPWPCSSTTTRRDPSTLGPTSIGGSTKNNHSTMPISNAASAKAILRPRSSTLSSKSPIIERARESACPSARGAKWSTAKRISNPCCHEGISRALGPPSAATRATEPDARSSCATARCRREASPARHAVCRWFGAPPALAGRSSLSCVAREISMGQMHHTPCHPVTQRAAARERRGRSSAATACAK